MQRRQLKGYAPASQEQLAPRSPVIEM
jgi:hypothetical protein